MISRPSLLHAYEDHGWKPPYLSPSCPDKSIDGSEGLTLQPLQNNLPHEVISMGRQTLSEAALLELSSLSSLNTDTLARGRDPLKTGPPVSACALAIATDRWDGASSSGNEGPVSAITLRQNYVMVMLSDLKSSGNA